LSTTQNFCEFCGAALTPGKRFCEQCGAAVSSGAEASPAGWQGLPPAPSPEPPAPEPYVAPQSEPEPPSPTPPAPSYSPPPARDYYSAAPPAQKKKRSPCLIIALILIAILVCIGAIIAAGFFLFRSSFSNSGDIATAVIGIVQTQAIPTPTPVPSDPLTPPDPGENQYQTDHSIYDDFSTFSLDWKEGSDDVGAWGYENGAYFIDVIQPGYMLWKFPPVSFQPTTAEFDAVAPSGPQDGTFGVICHYQDEDNFDYVEIDLSDSTYSFGRYTAGEQSALSSPDWNTAAYLNTDFQAVNHVMVACDPDMITLFVNNEYEDQVTLSELATPGDLAIFAATWDDSGPDGFKILFDNFSAWEPVQ